MRYCNTCRKQVEDSVVMMGKYWDGTKPCTHEGCDARFNIQKEREAYRQARLEAKEFDGPKAVKCAVCSETISAYESRHFGKTGAVHVHEPNCYRSCDSSLYPFYYTDG